MFGNLIFGIILLMFSAANYYYWRKLREKEYVWYALLYFTAAIISVENFLVYFFHLPRGVRIFSHNFLMVAMPIIAILSLTIFFRAAKEKRDLLNK